MKNPSDVFTRRDDGNAQTINRGQTATFGIRTQGNTDSIGSTQPNTRQASEENHPEWQKSFLAELMKLEKKVGKAASKKESGIAQDWVSALVHYVKYNEGPKDQEKFDQCELKETIGKLTNVSNINFHEAGESKEKTKLNPQITKEDRLGGNNQSLDSEMPDPGYAGNFAGLTSGGQIEPEPQDLPSLKHRDTGYDFGFTPDQFEEKSNNLKISIGEHQKNWPFTNDLSLQNSESLIDFKPQHIGTPFDMGLMPEQTIVDTPAPNTSPGTPNLSALFPNDQNLAREGSTSTNQLLLHDMSAILPYTGEASIWYEKGDYKLSPRQEKKTFDDLGDYESRHSFYDEFGQLKKILISEKDDTRKNSMKGKKEYLKQHTETPRRSPENLEISILQKSNFQRSGTRVSRWEEPSILMDRQQSKRPVAECKMVIDNSVLHAVLNLTKHTISGDPNSKHKSQNSGNQTDGKTSPQKSRFITPKDTFLGSHEIWRKNSDLGSDEIWKSTRPIYESMYESDGELEEGLSTTNQAFKTGLISKITRIQSSYYKGDEEASLYLKDQADTTAVNPMISLRQGVKPTDFPEEKGYPAPSNLETEHAGVTATKISILKGLEGIINAAVVETENELEITAKPSIMKKWNQWIETGHKNTLGTSLLHLMTHDKNQNQDQRPSKGSKSNSESEISQPPPHFGLKPQTPQVAPNDPKFRETAPDMPRSSETIFPPDKNRSVYHIDPNTPQEKSIGGPKRFCQSGSYNILPPQNNNFHSNSSGNHQRLSDDLAPDNFLSDLTEKKPKDTFGVSTVQETDLEDKDSVVSGSCEVYEIDDQIDFELISHETNSVFSYLNKSEIFADQELFGGKETLPAENLDSANKVYAYIERNFGIASRCLTHEVWFEKLMELFITSIYIEYDESIETWQDCEDSGKTLEAMCSINDSIKSFISLLSYCFYQILGGGNISQILGVDIGYLNAYHLFMYPCSSRFFKKILCPTRIRGHIDRYAEHGSIDLSTKDSKDTPGIPGDARIQDLGSKIINDNTKIPIRCSTFVEGPTKLKHRPFLRGILKPWTKPNNPRNATDPIGTVNSLYVKPCIPGIKEEMAEDEAYSPKNKTPPRLYKESQKKEHMVMHWLTELIQIDNKSSIETLNEKIAVYQTWTIGKFGVSELLQLNEKSLDYLTEISKGNAKKPEFLVSFDLKNYNPDLVSKYMNTTPYLECIKLLSKVEKAKTPIKKFFYLIRSIKRITTCVDRFYNKFGISILINLFADEFFPILIYIISKGYYSTFLPDLYQSEAYFPENLQNNEFGFYLNSTAASLEHIRTAQVDSQGIL